MPTKPAWIVLALCCHAFVSTNRGHAQLYAVKQPRTVWDSWLFREGDDYHLFYLQGPRDDRHIGRAVSQDLLHWQRLPWIDSVGKGDAWDRKITHTGWTVKIGDHYACLYGSSGTGRQLNGVMFSDDLLHWQKYPGNPVLVSTPPHYGGTDWRDPTAYFDADEDLWHGYICAQTAAAKPASPKLPTITDKTLPRNTPCIGHFTSKDLIHWEYLPPVYESADFFDLEVPDYFTQGGWHYFLFSSARTRRDTPSRRNASGTFYVMSRHRDGPYRLPPDPLILGSGNGRLDNYVGRVLPNGDGHLLYHHTVGGTVVWGTVKQIKQNEDGTLRLEYWPGLDGLETEVLFNSQAATEVSGIKLNGNWHWEQGALLGQTNAQAGNLHGKTQPPKQAESRNSSRPPSLCQLPVEVSDMIFTCRLESTPNAQAGLFCRFDGRQGIAITIDRSEETVQVAEFRHEKDRLTQKVLDTRYKAPLAKGPDELRILTRDHRIEVYLNNQWMFGITMANTFHGSGAGAIVVNGQAHFTNLRIAQIEPLIPTDP